MKNQWKKTCFFKPPSHFFQHGDPHETLYFTIRKLLFRFLSFWYFSEKIIKNCMQNWAQKNHQTNGPTGTQNGTKINKKWIGESRKSPKWPKKVFFWGFHFLAVFLIYFFMNFWSPGRPRDRPEIVTFPPFSNFFSKTGLDRAPERFVGPSGTPQGPFWDVFWSIFEVNFQTKNYGNIVFLRTLSSNFLAFWASLSCGQVTLIRATDELLSRTNQIPR